MAVEDDSQSVGGGGGIRSEYYRYLYACSSLAIIGADRQGVIVSWNHAAEELFNASSSKMLGRHIERIVPEGQRQVLRDSIERAVIGRKKSEFEFNHREEHGELLVLSIVIATVLDGDEQVLGVAAWISDVTGRKRLQQQLLEAEKMASLGTLASGVAHHFNNIIGGVATFVDYALHSNNPHATRRALQMTAEAAGRVSQITSSLLTFAEKDMRHFDLSDLTEVVLTFGHLVEHSLAKKNIKLELHLQAVPVYEVAGSRIHQILGNLLNNAERAMPNGGTITIGLRREDADLIMEFSDTGIGIEPGVLSRIFEPFFTTHGVAGGGDHACNGLGLSVVHGIVGELGGSIEAKSQLERGTGFVIRFPCKSKE